MRYRDLPQHIKDANDALCAHAGHTSDELLRAYIQRMLCLAFEAGHALASMSEEHWLVLPARMH